MSSLNPEYIIRAVIPHEEDPNRHIVTTNGEYPYSSYLPEDGTYERTFHRIGRTIGIYVLSIDRRELTSSAMEIIYRAKPIIHELSNEAGYRWEIKE